MLASTRMMEVQGAYTSGTPVYTEQTTAASAIMALVWEASPDQELFTEPWSLSNQSFSNASNFTGDGELERRRAVSQCYLMLLIFNGVIMAALCVLGMIGNTISILVLQKDKSNEVATFLLSSLAVTDNLVLLVALVAMGLLNGTFLYFPVTRAEVVHILPYIKKYGNPIGCMTQTCTIWMTVLLAVNRYVAICKPFHAPMICTMKRARIQVASVVCFSVLFNFPRFFQCDLTWVERANRTKCIPNAISESTLFGVIYTNALYTILVLLLPLVILGGLNTKLMLELCAMRRRRNSMVVSSPNREDNITLIMVIIILVFVCCHTPDRVLQVLIYALWGRIRCRNAPAFYFYIVCNLLVVVNSSTNFLVYYIFRSRFRRILLMKLCRCSGVKRVRVRTFSQLTNISLLSRSTIRKIANGSLKDRVMEAAMADDKGCVRQNLVSKI